MDYNLFLKCSKFADNYKMTHVDTYFFIKDLLFQRILKANGNRFPSQEIQNMYNSFQLEIQQSRWQRNSMSKNKYQNYLEDLFKKVDFKTIDLESCEILKVLTENIGIFGNFDELTRKRINYFNNKIHSLKSNPKPPNSANIFSIFNQAKTQIYPQHHHHHHNPQPQPHAHTYIPNNQNIPQNNNVAFDLPDVNKPSKEKKGVDPEMARLNEIMRQQKLNSPIYITNLQPGQFYNPYNMPNYIPKGVMTNIPLPMRKKDPNYPKLRAIIEKELILANQELDYHKIDYARNHLERAAFYLKNVID